MWLKQYERLPRPRPMRGNQHCKKVPIMTRKLRSEKIGSTKWSTKNNSMRH